jgi:hypothetical protein
MVTVTTGGEDIISNGETTEITIKVTDYRIGGGSNLTFETDLVQWGEKPLYDFFELNKELDSNKEINRYDNLVKINLPDQDEITVKMAGKTPQAVESKTLDGVNIVDYYTGPYKYFEIKLLDPNGKVIASKLMAFDILVEEKKEFEEKLKRIDRDDLKNLKSFAMDLHEKGLVEEADELASLLMEVPQPEEKLTYRLLIVFLLVCILGAYIIGFRRGGNEI